MLDELRGGAAPDGVRGRPGIDRAAVIAAIVAPRRRSSSTTRRLVEVDLNPVISGPDGTAAVDALVVEALG